VKEASKKKPPKKRKRIKRCIKRYSVTINVYKWLKLNRLLDSYCKQKDYFLCQYSDKKNIGTCANKFREIRKEWVRKGYVSSYGLQNRGWKLALKDSFETIDRYWASICYKIKKEIFKSSLTESQKIYLLWAIKSRQRFNDILNNNLTPFDKIELSEKKEEESIKYLEEIFKKVVKDKPRVKLYRSFIAEPETYRVFEKNGRQYIALTSLEKGKRIIIPLTGKTNIKGMIRVVFDFEKRRLEIHWVNNSKTKNVQKIKKTGIDLGTTEVFTDLNSNKLGKDFGKASGNHSENKYRHPKLKLQKSFIAEPEIYKILKINRKQHIALPSLEKGKRIIIPLLDNIKGIIRVVSDFEKRKLEIYWVDNSKTKDIQKTKDTQTKDTQKTKKIGIDLGITEVFTDSDGDRWGKDFGKTLGNYSEQIKDKGKKRNKLHALCKKYKDKGKKKKAKKILKNNLGKKKLRKKSKKRKIHLEQIVNKSFNDFFKFKAPKKIIYEDLTHLRGKTKSKKFSRLVSLWIRGIIRDRLEFKVSERCSLLKAVAAAYSSQACPNCGWVTRGNRKGDKFKCLFCNFIAQSDHSASLNLLRRDNDSDIVLWTPKAQIKSILIKRFKSRLENWDFNFKPSQVNWEAIKGTINNFDEIINKYSLV